MMYAKELEDRIVELIRREMEKAKNPHMITVSVHFVTKLIDRVAELEQEVAKDKVATTFVPHALQERCARCGFIKLAHENNYCPVGQMPRVSTFLSSKY